VLSFAAHSWVTRLAITAYSLWFYAFKTVIPWALAPLYELSRQLDPLEPRFIAAYAGVVSLTAVLVLMRTRWPAALAAWIAYGLLLAPVAGLVHTGVQLVADRYSYLPTLGAALLFGGAVGHLGTEPGRRSVQHALRDPDMAAGASLAGLGSTLRSRLGRRSGLRDLPRQPRCLAGPPWSGGRRRGTHRARLNAPAGSLHGAS
jgi:hypothetical protein